MALFGAFLGHFDPLGGGVRRVLPIEETRVLTNKVNCIIIETQLTWEATRLYPRCRSTEVCHYEYTPTEI